MIPLTLLITLPIVQDEDVKIDVPYAGIAETLAVLTVPILIGMTIKYYRPKWARKASKVLALTGLVGIIAVATLSFITFPKAVNFANKGVWVASVGMPFLGAVCGYALSYLMALLAKFVWNPDIFETFGHKQFRTVSLETGIQNIKVVTSIMTISFIDCPGIIMTMILLPLIYGRLPKIKYFSFCKRVLNRISANLFPMLLPS